MTIWPRIGVIGAGGMAQAIVAGLARGGLAAPANLGIAARTPIRALPLSAQYHLQYYPDLAQLANDHPVLLLCVKPRDLQAVANSLQHVDLHGTVLISTLAGVDLASLRQHFAGAQLIRAIPNIASAIAAGVTLWIAEHDTPAPTLELGHRLWQRLGVSMEVDYEQQLDIASPISGAAPAVIGLLVEALLDAAIYLGLPRAMAAPLIVQALIGSGELIKHENFNPQLVRQQVTSPGGLTAACIATLEAHGFRTALLQAIEAGYHKTLQLGANAPTL